MGFVGGLLGTAGGVNGTGISGPQGSTIRSPVTDKQALTAYRQTQQGLSNQLDFANQVAAQGGLQNQSDVYNRLANVASGTGPNPAQAMLANATAANTANQAAMMASQRGSNANIGLMGRQAAMQGAANQQNAAGQGAAMQATQSLNALNGMGSMANTMVGNQAAANNSYSQSAQNQQANLLNSIAGVNSAGVGMQSNINSANAGLANTTMQGQQNLMGHLMESGEKMGGMMSDENAKQNIHSADPQVHNFLNSISAKEYDYKPQFKGMSEAGPGQHTSPMAQDLEKTDLGSQMVHDTPQGKMVDYAKGFGTILAAQASLNDRLNKIEGKKMAEGGEVQSNVGAEMQEPKDMTQPMPPSQSMTSPAPQAPMPQVAVQPSYVPTDPSPAHFEKIENYFKSKDDSGGGGGGMGQMMQMAGPMMAAMSDSSNKQNIHPADKQVHKFLNQMGPQSRVGRHFACGGKVMMATGGMVPAMVSPGEKYLDRSDVDMVKKGSNPLAVGEDIKGKAKVKGNSLKNDTVPKDLEEGGIVIPRSIMQSKNASKEAAKFIDAILTKNKKLPKMGK